MRVRHLAAALALAVAGVLQAGGATAFAAPAHPATPANPTASTASAVAAKPAAKPAATAADTPSVWSSLYVRPLPGDNPLAFTLFGSAYSEGKPAEGAVLTYDFGDGSTPVVTADSEVQHTFPTSGTYDPTVTATYQGETSTASHLNMDTLRVGSGYTAVPGARLLDTRAAIGVPTRTPMRGGYASIVLPVTGVGGVPTTGTTSVVLNVTVTGGTSAGVLDIGAPNVGGGTSVVNWSAGQTIAAQTTVRVQDGSVMITNPSRGSVHVIVDVQGYYSQTHGYRYQSESPTRLLDTRARKGVPTTTPVPAHGTVTMAVAMPGGDAPNATAAILNVTVTGGTRAGFLTAYPAGGPRPSTSTLNWTAGQVAANETDVGVHDGKVTFYNGSPGTVHVIADLNGYFSPTASDSYRALFGPSRILDTRSAIGTASTGPVPAGSDVRLRLPLADAQGNTGQSGLMLHVTVTQPTASGFLAPTDGYANVPTDASVLNWGKGRSVADSIAQANTNGGYMSFHNHSPGSVHLIVDLLGYFDRPTPTQID